LAKPAANVKNPAYQVALSCIVCKTEAYRVRGHIGRKSRDFYPPPVLTSEFRAGV